MLKRIMGFALLGVLLCSTLSFAYSLEWTWPAAWDRALTSEEYGITAFSESPLLALLVAEGKLPPVQERLPKNPLVIEPFEKIGQYGGTLTVASTSVNAYNDITHLRIPNLFRDNPGVSEVIPDIAESFALLDGNSRLVISLREGLKWSDGHPFTAEDIMYWYEYEVLHDDISVWARSFWLVDGEFPLFTKIDDYTVEIQFAAPFRPTMGLLNHWTSQQSNFFSPAHYMKQYHIAFNELEELNELAKEFGYDTWQAHYYSRADLYPGQKYPELPVVGPWMLKERSSTGRIYERNPYFYAVDTEGNQLPYIDRLEVRIISDREVAVLDAMQGNLDIAGFILSPAEFGMYMQNQQRGDYRVLVWRSANSSEVTYAFNQNHPDPQKRALFNDVRFRQAMSLAIDREEINQFVYQGMGTPSQVTVDPSASYFKPQWAESFAEFDPDSARALLQEIGLTKGRDGFFRGLDGEALTIELHVPSGAQTGTVGFDEVNELVAQYWREVGINTDFRMVSRDLYGVRSTAGEHDITAWHADTTQELRIYMPRLSKFEMGRYLRYAVKWGQWYTYQNWLAFGEKGPEPGNKGEEPPQFVKEHLATLDSWYKAQTDEEYQSIATKLFDFHAEQLWLIGTVARSLRPIIVTNKLQNMPVSLPFADDNSFWRLARAEQWYFVK